MDVKRAYKPTVSLGLASNLGLHQKTPKKPAGEAGVLAPYLGYQGNETETGSTDALRLDAQPARVVRATGRAAIMACRRRHFANPAPRALLFN